MLLNEGMNEWDIDVLLKWTVQQVEIVQTLQDSKDTKGNVSSGLFGPVLLWFAQQPN